MILTDSKRSAEGDPSDVPFIFPRPTDPRVYPSRKFDRASATLILSAAALEASRQAAKNKCLKNILENPGHVSDLGLI